MSHAEERRVFIRFAAASLLAAATGCRPRIPDATGTPTPTSPPTLTSVPTYEGEVLTEAPPAPPTPTPPFEQQMQEAMASGEETITTLDPQGIEVVVDVPSAELTEGAQWDWNYRAFTRVDENGIRYVLRHLGEGWMWLEVLDEWDLTEHGWGIWTLEGDRAALAAGNGSIKSPIRNPRFNKSQEVLDGMLRFQENYISPNPIVSYPEVDNLGKYGHGNIPDLPNENIVLKGVGVSIYLDDKYGSSSSAVEAGSAPGEAWNAQSEAGRPLLTEYHGQMVYKGKNLTAGNITFLTFELLRWLSTGPTEGSIGKVLTGGGATYYAGSGIKQDTKDALSVFLGIEYPGRVSLFPFYLVTTD